MGGILKKFGKDLNCIEIHLEIIHLYNFVKCNVTDLERIILRDIKVKGDFLFLEDSLYSRLA